jgi:hypothetical protein
MAAPPFTGRAIPNSRYPTVLMAPDPSYSERPLPGSAPTGQACLALFAAGLSVPAIARRLGVGRDAVRARLAAAGCAAPTPADHSPGNFAVVWNATPDLGAAAKALGMTEAAARCRASRLRAEGHRLKRMPRR